MTGATVIQKPFWEEDLQTALDHVNSTLGEIDALGGAKAEYEEARGALESLLNLVLSICREEWTAAYPINEWVYNYKRYVKGPSCDCMTVKEKDIHISLVYSTTSGTAGIAGAAKGSKRFEDAVALAVTALVNALKPDVKAIKKYNCCMDKIEKGVKKRHQELGAMANKRHVNGLKRQASKPMVTMSENFQNGGHLSGAAGVAAQTGVLSAELSGVLSAALGGNFGAGIFGNASLQLGCESYSFSEGITANVGGSMGFNFGFSICSPKLGASANVLSSYSGSYYANALGSLSGGIGWTPSSSVNYTANTNGGVLDATLAKPFENFDRKKNCKCATDNDAGLAGDLIPPNGNLDTHDEVLQKAQEQTRVVKEKIEELKCKTYCCCKKSKAKKEKTKKKNIEQLIYNNSLLIEPDPTITENLNNIIMTQNYAFFNPDESLISNEATIVEINNTLSLPPVNTVVAILDTSDSINNDDSMNSLQCSEEEKVISNFSEMESASRELYKHLDQLVVEFDS